MPSGTTAVPHVLHGCSAPNGKLDKVCDLPGRDPKLPAIHEAFNHPLTQCANGRSFYVKQELHEEAMQEALDLEKELKIPFGIAEEVSALGKNLLYTRIIVNYMHRVSPTASRRSFIFKGAGLTRRWIRGCPTNMGHRAVSVGPCRCAFQANRSKRHRDSFTPEMKTKIDEARDEALGCHNERTPQRPIYRDRTFTGGTAFERNNRAHGIHGTRCYPLVNSFERQPLLAAPSATSKRIDTEWDDSLLMRRNIVRVRYTSNI